MNVLADLARRRILRKKRFYQHLSFFLGVNLFLFALNAVLFLTNGWSHVPGEGFWQEVLRYPYWWFVYPLLSWGMLMFIHYCWTFGIPLIGHFDEKWENEAIDLEIQRLQAKTEDRLKLQSTAGLDLKSLKKEAQPQDPTTGSEYML